MVVFKITHPKEREKLDVKHYIIYLASFAFSLFSQLSFAVEGVDVIWNKYPNNLTQFDYSGEKLKQHWEILSAGPAIQWPDEKYIKNTLARYPDALQKTIEMSTKLNAHPALKPVALGNFEPMALAIQDLFRLHYQGDFQKAYSLGERLGPVGLVAGLYSKLIHTTFLEENSSSKRKRFSEVDKMILSVVPLLSDYDFLLFADSYQKSRRLELLSTSDALLSGLVGPTQKQLKNLNSEYPNVPMYHALIAGLDAGIIERVGGFLARASYGADEGEVIAHFDYAIESEPRLAVLYNEYIQALLRVGVDKQSKTILNAVDHCLKLTVYSAEEALNQLNCKRYYF